MGLNEYRKRKMAARHANEPPKPYACDKCHKTFAYMESVKCHAKQSPGCRYADFIILNKIAPAQPSTGHSHHGLQPHSALMCEQKEDNGNDFVVYEIEKQGPRCEPAREHQENPQGLEDGDKKNLEGLEVEEDVEAKAAAQDDGGAPQERRRPSKTKTPLVDPEDDDDLEAMSSRELQIELVKVHRRMARILQDCCKNLSGRF